MWSQLVAHKDTPHTIPPTPSSCRTSCRCGVSERQAVISPAVKAIYTAPSKGDLSLTHPRSPPTPSENHKNVLSSLPLPTLRSPYLVLFYLFSQTHTDTPIIRHRNGKRRRNNPKWLAFDPLQQPGRIQREWWREGRGGDWESSQAYTSTQSRKHRASKASLHQSSRHNLRPPHARQRPHAYGLMTARIGLFFIRSMAVMAS